MATRIVVLDAEPVVRSVVSDILERGGYAVQAIETLQDAIGIVKDMPPDLLITNVNLPGVSGMDAMKLLKGICPDLRVLMVSGLPEQAVIDEFFGRDGFETFPKPFRAEELLDKVRTMISR